LCELSQVEADEGLDLRPVLEFFSQEWLLSERVHQDRDHLPCLEGRLGRSLRLQHFKDHIEVEFREGNYHLVLLALQSRLDSLQLLLITDS